MKTKVRLFINDQELEFTGKPSVLYNFNLDSISNPTAVKNQYTKTIQVEGTPRNNKIFGHIWDLTRTQSDNFNPSKRTPFELYIDGELYETGYVKLNSVTNTHNKIVYNITLYGGIGDFLYNLSYMEDGEQLKLKDLHYISSADPTTELDFRINIGSIYSAWVRFATQGMMGAPMFDVINFAPCYNGYPNDFDADKVLINTNGFTGDTRLNINGATSTQVGFPTGVTVDGSAYTTINGYAYAEIPNKVTEWDMRDLRSYLQRPVLNMKYLIDACCDPVQNGGYTVELDPSFFNSDNKYYTNAWVTLPMLNELKYDDEVVEPYSGTHSGTSYYGAYKRFYYYNDNTTRTPSASAIEVTFRPRISIQANLNPPTTRIYCASNIGGQYWASSYVYQLIGVGYDNESVCGSEAYSLTTDINGTYMDLTNYPWYTPQFQPPAVYTRLGYFDYVDDETIDGVLYRVYQWTEDITLRMNTNGARVRDIAIDLQGVGNRQASYGYVESRMFSSTTLSTFTENTNTWKTFIIGPETITGSTYYASGTQINSNSVVTKQTLLGMDGTPCDYLVGYLKTFGLYLRKDPLQKTIQILTRENYYQNEIVNIEDLIDRTKEIEIKPITFDKKWYSFNYTTGDTSAVEDKYYDKYGTNYGTEKVNTGYNFDNETNDLLNGLIYKNAADCLEKSAYFVDRYYGTEHNYPTFLYSWVDYKLLSGDETCDKVKISMDLSLSDADLGDYGQYYDNYPKVQLRDSDRKTLAGDGVLLFYNGMHNTVNSSGDPITYRVSDDINDMFSFGGDKPCWLYTDSIFDSNGHQIIWDFKSLPWFARDIYSGDTIVKSWDFGKVKELYTPGTFYGENANIYDQYWKNYINDLYDINTRLVKASVKLPKTQGDELLRKFYWFDNSLWRINKISDWNVADEDTTKVEFIKVQDKFNYIEASTGMTVSQFGPNPTSVVSAETVCLYDIRSQVPWTATVISGGDFITLSRQGGEGDPYYAQTLEVFYDENTTGSDRYSSIEISNGYVTTTLTKTQLG